MNFNSRFVMSAFVAFACIKSSYAKTPDLHASLLSVFLAQPAGLVRAFSNEDICEQLGEFAGAGAEARQANVSRGELQRRFVAPQKVKVVRDLQNAILTHIYSSEDDPVQRRIEVRITCAGALAEAEFRQGGK